MKILKNRTSIGVGAFYKKPFFPLLRGKKETNNVSRGTIN